MTTEQTTIPGVDILIPKQVADNRGVFVKTFQASVYEKLGWESGFQEHFYSVSQKNVIRGMHFQVPPLDHAKLVYVVQGTVYDVVLDLRVGSPAFGRYYNLDLSEGNRKCLYIPRGIAHGFAVRSDCAVVVYAVTTEYSPQHYGGIRFDSFGADWGVDKPVLSDGDAKLPAWEAFQSPFHYSEEK